MQENIYLCRNCRNVFRVAVAAACMLDGSRPPEPDTTCTRCGSTDTGEMSSWAPPELNEAPRFWEYECRQCRHVFRMPVPKSPSLEKAIMCPECRADDIRRLTEIHGEPLYCG